MTTTATTALIEALARQTADRAAALADLRSRGIYAQTVTLTADERADLLDDLHL